jgi:exopolyphosphatase / guanosine-5'-triphosphate,3'-diphosphate pyrophosphatase
MPRVAAIDCGTNSIRLLVADVSTGDTGPGGPGESGDAGPTRTLTDVHREMRVVRLGQGVDATGEFVPEAIERTRVALADYTAILRAAGTERVRMVATSATRDAGNREDFFAMVRATLGTDAEVISGDTEARLSFTGAVGDLPAEDGPFVVVDVGGGSTEVVLGTRDAGGVHVEAARSVDIGCVRLTERCLHSDPPTAEQRAAARTLARAVLAGAFEAVPVAGARTWVGVAGTVTTISAVSQNLPKYDESRTHLSRLALPEVHRVADELLSRTREQRMEFGAMHPGRVDVIGAGALIVSVLAEELAERAGITELVVSEHDILDGIALSLA